MRLKSLIKELEYKRLENVTDCEIKGISCSSENIRPGYLFVAIAGCRHDGHSFVKEAIARGAVALILEKNLPLKEKPAKILVSDSQTALAAVCARFFGHPAGKLKVIGVTGTNGKTTVSYLIEKILNCAGYPSGIIGTVSYRVGRNERPAVNTTPQADLLQSLLQEIVLSKSKYAIIEVSSHALAQRRVEGVSFSSALFTNLTPEHLDYHKSLSRYFSCKASLFEGLSASSLAIVNTDDPYGRKLVKRINSRLLTFGIASPAQIQAKDIALTLKQSRFKAVTPKGTIEITSPLIGRHNVYNILAAISAAFAENIDFAHIASGVGELNAVCGRLERVDCGQAFELFIDYAHTEDALEKILQALRQVSKNRIILVFGCGGDRDKAKRPAMGKVATELSDLAIITSDNPRSEEPERIISDILKGVDKKKDNYQVVLDRFEAIGRAVSLAGAADTVVIAGKGHETVQIFADRTIHFNDREAVEKVLDVHN